MLVFPPIEPHACGLLAVGDDNEIYWEASGRPDGIPVLHLHGGPGAGLGPGGYRRRVDPSTHLVVGLDQRGCGRSRPLVTDRAADLGTNTTSELIEDVEALRRHLGIETWLVDGVSWGTTLALAYAQAHPTRTTGLVLTAVTTTSTTEVEWLTEAMGRVFPREWESFADAVDRREGERLVDAYARALTSTDAQVRQAAARAWCTWEDVHVSLAPGHRPDPRFDDPHIRAVLATLITHYWSHAGFGGDDILGRMSRIADIPGVLVHGRWDVSSPLATAWELHRRWPASQLVVVDEGHGGLEMMAEATAAITGLTG